MNGRLFRYGVGIIAMALLVWYVGPAELAHTLRGMAPLPVLAYLLAFLAVPFIYGLQLHGALRIAGYNLSAKHTVAATVNSWSVGTLTPARAGDLTLAYFLGDSVRPRDAHALVIVDKAVSLLVLAALGVLSAPLIPASIGPSILLGAGIILGAAILGLILISLPNIKLPVQAELRAFVRQPRILLWCTSMAALRWSYISVINLIIFRAVQQTPDIATVTAATAVGRLISIVPVSIGGIGVKEPVQIIIYAGVGISSEAVVAVSVVGLACGFVVAALAPIVARMFGAPTPTSVKA